MPIDAPCGSTSTLNRPTFGMSLGARRHRELEAEALGLRGGLVGARDLHVR
jgi:hypothetical protein